MCTKRAQTPAMKATTAVLGTGVATRRIKTGDQIRVDGDGGTVELLVPSAAGDGG